MSTVYTVNGKVLKNAANDKWLKKKPILPPISSSTVRVRTSDGNPPLKKESGASYDSATLVAGTSDIYDVYKSGAYSSYLLRYSTNVVEVLGANTTGVQEMSGMFWGCTSLTSVSLFDTSNITTMNSMFKDCTSLTYIPLFNTSNVTDTRGMFQGCTNVEGGALALYQQASSQTTPPSSYGATFRNCGSNTTTGAAELEQIPSGWK